MADYIEREAADKALRKEVVFCVTHMKDGESRGYIGASKIIKNIPTADAAPVRHGRWDEWSPPMHLVMTGEELLYVCSACTAKYSDVEGYKYCPNCGARMDGGAGGED